MTRRAADPALRALGQRLRTARQAQGLSQPQVAARAKVSERSLRDLEEGARWPNLETLVSVCKVLGLRITFVPGRRRALAPGELLRFTMERLYELEQAGKVKLPQPPELPPGYEPDVQRYLRKIAEAPGRPPRRKKSATKKRRRSDAAK